jgi:hypothetical protein
MQSVNFHPSVFEVREAKLRHFSETADAVTHISFHRRLSGAVVSGITATLEAITFFRRLSPSSRNENGLGIFYIRFRRDGIRFRFPQTRAASGSFSSHRV